MRAFVVFIASALLFCACGKDSGENKVGSANTGAGVATSSTTPHQLTPGDNVIFMFDEYHFYEAKLSSVEGNRAKLLYDERTIERDLSDVYQIPKAGDQVSVKAGDFVAARYGQLPTWPTAKVVKVGDNKITVQWVTNNDTVEVSPENVLAVSPSAASKIRDAAAKKGK